MQPKRINKWLNQSDLLSQIDNKEILSWLNEEGSITKRISSKTNFLLEILKDDIGNAQEEEYKALNIIPEEVRIREVILYGNSVPLVFARSIIPKLVSTIGYPGLGSIGSKPLGDLIFESDLFIKICREFAEFQNDGNEIIWGRRTQYEVKGYPLSIMEVFLFS